MSRVEALVKPKLLIWARESAGIAREASAKTLKIDLERFISWEAGITRPTVPQLRKLAKLYKRPLAVFFLAEPPEGFDVLHDFRRLAEAAVNLESPALRFGIRRAMLKRDLAIELYERLEEPPPEFIFDTKLLDDPQKTAESIRKLLKIDVNAQRNWSNESEAYSAWRAAIERTGILVFQAGGIEVAEARGFSIADRPLPAIFVNSRDSLRGRIFTLLHEFVHIGLGDGGVCDFDERRAEKSHDQVVETFCNYVAGAVLVPSASLLSQDTVASRNKNYNWTTEEVNALAQFYKVSGEVVLRRLLILGKATEELYRKRREEWIQKYEKTERKKTKLKIPEYRKIIASAGLTFANLVLQSYHREVITASDLSDYLDMRLKHLPKIEKALFSRSAVRGGTS